MLQRIAARPLALTAALLLFFPACDSADSDSGGTNTDTEGVDTDAGTTSTETSDAGTSSTQGSSGLLEGSSSGEESGSSSSGEESGSSSSGEESGSSSSGGAAIGYVDLYGEYIDNFEGTHILSDAAWTQAYMGMNPFALNIEEVDDDAQWVAGAEGNAGTYGRHDWAFDDDGQLRLCTGSFGAKSLQEAIDAPPSNADDFDGVGCGGAFSWSILTPVP